MSAFHLDIEKFYQHFQETGGQLKGILCLQYPVYCIHANICDVTPDAMENIDRLIAGFYLKSTRLSAFQIGSLLGTSQTFIEMRTAALLRDGLLENKDGQLEITTSGKEVFQDKLQERQHNRAYDFYLDGISLKPLPQIFYNYYRSKLISEHDIRYFTNAKGETYTTTPFGPDIVHTPPDQPVLVDHIFAVAQEDREDYGIPSGLVSIAETAFTRQTFQLLVAVSTRNGEVVKEIIDGFAVYSLSDGLSYYETVKKHIRAFEPFLLERIQNLEFRIIVPPQPEDTAKRPRPIVTSNWGETDRYKDIANRCFSFSSEDLLKVVEEFFEIRDVLPGNLINTGADIEINLTKKMLMNSADKYKLLASLIRQRDYHMGNPDRNVFVLYLYYKTDDPFVEEVLGFSQLVRKSRKNTDLNHSWFTVTHPEFAHNYRELLIAAGELETLENIDIQQHMRQL